MSNAMKIGIALVILGVAGFLVGHFTYTDTKPVLKAGPVQVTTEEHHHVWIPEAASAIVLLAGVVLIVVGRTKA